MSITGARAKAGYGISNTFGTADTLTAGDQLAGVQITHSENAEAIQVPVQGSGLEMVSEVYRGAVVPTVNVSGPVGYDDPKNAMIAQMFGSASVAAIGASGAYVHSIFYNTTLNHRWGTLAWQGTSTNSFEYPSCATTQVQISGANPPDFLQASIDLLANEQVITGQENDYADLNSVTIANPRRVLLQKSDEFLINAQAGGALTSPTDRVNFTSITINYQRPQEHAREVRGVSGNGEPIAVGDYPFISSVSVTFRTLADFTYFTAAQAGTEYKASLTCTGGVIGGGNNYTYQMLFPRLKIVESPQADLVNAGDNPLTVTFNCMVASSPATGMPISVYPHIRIINNRSSAYL